MKTNQIIAGISAAAVLAMVTPAYAGLLGGGAGAVGGISGIGGVTGGGMAGQGAFDGRGAASTSFDKWPARPMSGAAKPATTGVESAQRSGVGAAKAAKAASGSTAHEADGSVVTALGQASGQSSSAISGAASAPTQDVPAATHPASASKTTPSSSASQSTPSSVTSAAGAGNVDAQSSRSDNSIAVSGEASGSASRTQ
jgi:hypothetical protein